MKKKKTVKMAILMAVVFTFVTIAGSFVMGIQVSPKVMAAEVYDPSADPDLLLFEGFDGYAVNEGLHGKKGGYGWGSAMPGWVGDRDKFEEGSIGDVAVRNSNPLIYPGLMKSSNNYINLMILQPEEVF